mgnify:CR=1 FL=1
MQVVDRVGELLNFAVPSGAFGNLCAGSLAREMGLPVGKFILSNNANNCLQRIFRDGIYASFVASASDEFKDSYLQAYFDVVVED